MSDGSPMARWRRRTAMVMAAMLAVALVPLAGPAGAQPAPAPDISAACADAESAGFTDTAGTGFETEIDCLAGFGVTTGTTATTYSPAVQVRRSQMALFYYRVGVAAGLTWDTSDAGFGDLAGLEPDFVDAVNALANAGIVQGTSATEFSPQDRIRRSQMALFIDRFQEELTGFGYSDGFTGSDLFPDIDTLSAEARLAVNGIGSVGISQGDASGNYVPSGFVSRQQMAAFIVRHLAENGLEVPGADVSGVIIEANDFGPGDAAATGDEYIISTGDEIVTAEVGADPEFFLDGVSATAAVFAGSAGVGDMITWNEDADTHDVSPQDVLTAGFVVGEELHAGGGGSTNLIEPYSGATLEFNTDPTDPTDFGDSLDLDRNTSGDSADDPIYRVGNQTVADYDAFAAEISFGDVLTVENYNDADEAVIYRLQNDSIVGGFADTGDYITGLGSNDIEIRVDTDGRVEYAAVSPAGVTPIGNEPDTSDTWFTLTDTGYVDGEQRFTAEGAPYDHDGIDAWLTGALDDLEGDDFIRLTYSRSGGVEQFVFTVVDAEDPAVEPGSISGTFVAGSAVYPGSAGGTSVDFQVLVDGDVYDVIASSPEAAILVDGVITAVNEVPTDVDAGASVTISVEDDSQISDTATQVDVYADGDLVLITNP
ncbi:MAG: S-layer homology domain-containing protein [Acidimicrobiales bacterium]|nr:S-layer homology domain-containing protein [Acidimicrobiales bacterium]